MRRLKVALIGAMLVGALGSITVPRVFAVFTAETRNVQAAATSGTLVMDVKVGAGAACFSYNGPASPGNVNGSCTALYTYSPSNELYPGDAPLTFTIAVKNEGSLDASNLRLYMPGGCANSPTGDAPSPGGGNPCGSGGLQIYVQETTPSGPKCWFPVAAGACSFVSNSLAVLATATTVASALDLGAGPASLATRTFTIGLQMPATASNALQGQAAGFVLAWRLNS